MHWDSELHVQTTYTFIGKMAMTAPGFTLFIGMLRFLPNGAYRIHRGRGIRGAAPRVVCGEARARAAGERGVALSAAIGEISDMNMGEICSPGGSASL